MHKAKYKMNLGADVFQHGAKRKAMNNLKAYKDILTSLQRQYGKDAVIQSQEGDFSVLTVN